jgi:hypothetical protein
VITGRNLPAIAYVTIARNGNRAMPAFRLSDIDDATLQQLADYLASTPAQPAKAAPGRPMSAPLTPPAAATADPCSRPGRRRTGRGGLPGLAQAAATPQGQPAAGRPPEISTLVSGARWTPPLCKVCARRSTTAAPRPAPTRRCKAWTRQLHPARALARRQQATLLLGLLDDASATLVLDLVRSAGGRVLAVNTSSTGRRRRQDWARAGPHAGQCRPTPPRRQHPGQRACRLAAI